MNTGCMSQSLQLSNTSIPPCCLSYVRTEAIRDSGIEARICDIFLDQIHILRAVHRTGENVNTELSQITKKALSSMPEPTAHMLNGSDAVAVDYSLDIISATWGNFVVTTKVQQMYYQYVLDHPDSNIFNFKPSNELFGDPFRGTAKYFTMVWRVILANSSDTIVDSKLYSEPFVAGCLESEELTVNYDGSKLTPFTEPTNPLNGIYVLGATFWTYNVTNTVSKLASATTSDTLVVPASKTQFPGQTYGNPSQLAITYGYLLENGLYQYNCKTAWEGDNVSILVGPAPPRLLIQWADWGGVDFTDEITALVTFDQTLTFDLADPSKYGWAEPKPNQKTTMNVLYQWDGRALELLVASNDGGPQALDPAQALDPSRAQFFNPSSGRNAGELNIIAVIWGKMDKQAAPVSIDVFNHIQTYGNFTPTNSFFGLDGWWGVLKTACIFYQYGVSGQIQCTSAWEDLSANPKKVDLAAPNVDFGDPLPAKGLLRNFDQARMQGLKFKSLKTQQYLALDAVDKSSKQLGLTSSADTAAIFNIVNVSTGDQHPVLKVHPAQNKNLPVFYVQMVNGKAKLVQDIASASEVHYELPGIGASTSALLSFPSVDARNEPMLICTNLETRSVSCVRVYSHPITDCLLEFSWVLNDMSQALVQTTPDAQEAGGVQLCKSNLPFRSRNTADVRAVPCTVGLFSLVKDMLWDLPTLITGAAPLDTSGILKGITKWFNTLTTPLQAKVTQLMTTLWTALQNLLGLAGKAGSTKAGITAYWPIIINAIKSFYESGTLWSLYGFIAKNLSWWDYLIIVANLTKFALMLIGSVAVPAAPAIFYAAAATEWIVGTTKDVLAVIKECTPSNVSAATRRALSRLTQSMRIAISTSASFAKLTVFEQNDVINALLSPHWNRIYLGGSARPPAHHLGDALKKELARPGVPHDPALLEFKKNEYALSAAAAVVVNDLRPQIEHELMKLEGTVPKSLEGPEAGVPRLSNGCTTDDSMLQVTHLKLDQHCCKVCAMLAKSGSLAITSSIEHQTIT